MEGGKARAEPSASVLWNVCFVYRAVTSVGPVGGVRDSAGVRDPSGDGVWLARDQLGFTSCPSEHIHYLTVERERELLLMSAMNNLYQTSYIQLAYFQVRVEHVNNKISHNTEYSLSSGSKRKI